MPEGQSARLPRSQCQAFSGVATEGSGAHSRGTRRAPCPHRPALNGRPSSTARDGRDVLGPTWTAGTAARRPQAGAAPPSVEDRWALVARVCPSPSARHERPAHRLEPFAARARLQPGRRQGARLFGDHAAIVAVEGPSFELATCGPVQPSPDHASPAGFPSSLCSPPMLHDRRL